MSNKEETLKKSIIAYERAKKKLEKAQKAFQDEVDAIVLRPVRMREITRDQAVKLAHAINDDESFSIIMEIAKVPGYALAEREDISGEKEAK